MLLFAEAIDDLERIQAKLFRMKNEFQFGRPDNTRTIADLDDAAGRIRLAIRKLMDGEG